MSYEKIFEEVKDFTTRRMSNIVKNIILTERELANFTDIIIPLKNKENTENHNRNWLSIAVDGGMGNVSLQGIGFVIATAHTYSTASITIEDKLRENTDVQLISLSSGAEDSIVGTLYMKALEYKVAVQSLTDICIMDEDLSKLVLFDGSLSFPDRNIGLYGQDQELASAFKEFERCYDSFIKKCIELRKKNQNIFVCSIAKDPRNPKYLRALKKKFEKTDKEKAKLINKHLNSHKRQERKLISILSKAYSVKNKQKKDIYPIYTEINEVNQSLKLDLPSDYFKTHELHSIYYQTHYNTTPFYLEFPDFSYDLFQEGLAIVNFLSEISPIEGYPYPLVYVDILARVSKKTASQIFHHLKKEFITQHPKYAYYVIKDEFRAELHR